MRRTISQSRKTTTKQVPHGFELCDSITKKNKPMKNLVVYSVKENARPLLDMHTTPEDENSFMHVVRAVDSDGNRYELTTWELPEVGEVLEYEGQAETVGDDGYTDEYVSL
jgi:hypothetical protein